MILKVKTCDNVDGFYVKQLWFEEIALFNKSYDNFFSVKYVKLHFAEELYAYN